MSDLISRQAALEILDDYTEDIESGKFGAYTRARISMLTLPSAEPERKKGEWVDGKCNRCGANAPYWPMATTYYCSEYCPKCGAKMVDSQGREVDG